MPEARSADLPTPNAFVESTADLDPEARVGRSSHDHGGDRGRQAGRADLHRRFLEANAQVTVVATSNGLFAYHRSTDADFSVARTPDGTGSGWARRARTGMPSTRRRRTHRRAEGRGQPQPAGDRAWPSTAVLEPQAVNDLVPLLGNALNARNADEGRSPFSKPGGGTRIGEGRRRARHALLRSDRSRAARSPVRQPGPADRTHGLDREGCAEEPGLQQVLGAEAGQAADRQRARRWSRADRRHRARN